MAAPSGPANERVLWALLGGLAAGALVLVAGVGWLRLAHAPGMVKDLVTFGLAIIVAPVAAGVSAVGMRASGRRVLARAGLAIPLTFVAVSLLDYAMTIVLLAPDTAGPFQGKSIVTTEDVARVAKDSLLRRHVMACALGLLGGSILGVWRGPARKQ